MMPVQPLLQYLQNELGFEAERIGTATVERALRSRLAACGLTDAAAYLARIHQDMQERQAFIDAVIVPESWFMRGPTSFAFIAQWVRQRLRSSPLRCLSVACAGGEEPYSLAISLGAAGLTQGSVLIDAVDISARIIAHARRGIYSNFSLRAVDASFQQRYFQPLADGRYQLNPVWLDWPRWYQGNIVENAWHPPSAPYDVIFCRNVLIYLTLPMQRHLMRRLRQWLAPSGVLIVGHAEGQLACQFFRPIGEAHAFAFTPQPSSPGLTTQALSHHPQTSLAFELTPDITASVFSPPSPTAAPVTVQTWDPPAVVPTQAVASLDATPSLALAQRLADQGDWSAARTACVACLAVRPQAEGFFLLGLLAFVQKQGAEAEAHWHKAVYLSPDHAPTLRYLSLLKQQQGDLSQAQRWHRRWQRSMPA